MKVIAGLGNPGAEYAQTKHNVGFMLLDALAGRLGCDSWRENFSALVTETRLGAEKILLVKPLTYMNESGRAVGAVLDWYKLSADDLTVAHDDMDLPVGMVRIRRQGSSGGHKGIKSILDHIGDEHFARVRIGIGRPRVGWTVINHVLAPFAADDAAAIRGAIDYLLPAVECLLKEGVDIAMNRYNPKKQKKSAAKEPSAAAPDLAAGQAVDSDKPGEAP